MTGAAQSRLLPDGRLHLHHGPIDLIIDAEGPERATAFDQARDAFVGVLGGLVEELEILRAPAGSGSECRGPVARWMMGAVMPHLPCFVTPMAAVAGAVADHVLAAMTRGTQLIKAHVNNGGDIAFHLENHAVFRAAEPASGAVIEIPRDSPWRGIATSGWRGRSQSLGIADAVTVLARTAAEADVAATLIANAVDVPDHPGITRVPARERAPDSDLGDRLVTVGVEALTPGDIASALAAGSRCAEAMLRRDLIGGAAITLMGATRITGSFPTLAGGANG